MVLECGEQEPESGAPQKAVVHVRHVSASLERRTSVCGHWLAGLGNTFNTAVGFAS